MAEQVFYATGKRKTSVARVWMRPGTGDFKVNRRSLEDYLKREADRSSAKEPLKLTDTMNRLNIDVTVAGGGVSGQAAAIRHGISRALMEMEPSLREILKKQGFLTRDDRIKERKKYGQRGARARFQFSKR